MHFLAIDERFGTAIYVFLESDPRGTEAYPGFAVREVDIEFAPAQRGAGRRSTLGRDPRHLNLFREFRSDGAAAGAGFILIEPRYVGPNWEAYSHEFRPQGEKPSKSRHRPTGDGEKSVRGVRVGRG